MRDVLVIGGGISGLSFAYRCAQQGADVRVLEKSASPGGCIHSEVFESGFWLEMGAHTAYNSYMGLIEMIEACGLRDRITERARVPFRLLRDGELRSIPSELGILEILRSLPRIPFARKEGASVETYYSRLVGRRNYRRVLSPMLAAVPSQNADGFPATMLFKKRPRRKDVSRSFTLSGGLQTVIDGLVGCPGVRLETGVEVEAVSRSASGFAIRVADGRSYAADTVVLAVPPPVASSLLASAEPELAATLGRIDAVTVDSVGVVVGKSTLSIPPVAGIFPVGDVFFSAVSRDTVPDPVHRGFAFHFRPGLGLDERLERITSVLGVERQDLVEVVERRVVLPAPGHGHDAIVGTIDRLTAGSRLSVVGNFFAGLAIEDCVGRAFAEFSRLQGLS